MATKNSGNSGNAKDSLEQALMKAVKQEMEMEKKLQVLQKGRDSAKEARDDLERKVDAAEKNCQQGIALQNQLEELLQAQQNYDGHMKEIAIIEERIRNLKSNIPQEKEKKQDLETQFHTNLNKILLGEDSSKIAQQIKGLELARKSAIVRLLADKSVEKKANVDNPVEKNTKTTQPKLNINQQLIPSMSERQEEYEKRRKKLQKEQKKIEALESRTNGTIKNLPLEKKVALWHEFYNELYPKTIPTTASGKFVKKIKKEVSLQDEFTTQHRMIKNGHDAIKQRGMEIDAKEKELKEKENATAEQEMEKARAEQEMVQAWLNAKRQVEDLQDGKLKTIAKKDLDVLLEKEQHTLDLKEANVQSWIANLQKHNEFLGNTSSEIKQQYEKAANETSALKRKYYKLSTKKKSSKAQKLIDDLSTKQKDLKKLSDAFKDGDGLGSKITKSKKAIEEIVGRSIMPKDTLNLLVQELEAHQQIDSLFQGVDPNALESLAAIAEYDIRHSEYISKKIKAYDTENPKQQIKPVIDHMKEVLAHKELNRQDLVKNYKEYQKKVIEIDTLFQSLENKEALQDNDLHSRCKGRLATYMLGPLCLLLALGRIITKCLPVDY